MIGRARLAGLIDDVAGRYRVATVTAAVGYGKSTLLSQWRERLDGQGLATAWVSLDQDDNDPIRFLSYVVGALQDPHPGFGDRLLVQLLSGAVPSLQPALNSLVAELETLDRQCVLFLDDFHHIADPATAKALDWLIEYAPAAMSFVIASRTHPPLSLNRLRMRAELLEITAEALSFRLDEGQAYASAIAGIELDEDAAAALCERTEGWAAGLQLALLAIESDVSRSSAVAELSGRDRAVTDYLGEVVLSQQTPRIRNFLLKSSVLDRMCADLCREVTGEEDGQTTLEEIEDASLFLIPLDRERRWFRYHQLFSEFLRGQLRREDLNAEPALCLTAGHWFAAQGSSGEAVEYALRAGDHEYAAELIGGIATDLVQHQGDHRTLLQWKEQLPERFVARWPAIGIGYAWSLTFTRKHAGAEIELARLEAGIGESVSDEANEIRSAVGMIRTVIAGFRDDTEYCRKASADWLENWPDATDFNRGTVGHSLSYACLGSFEFDLARKANIQAKAAFERCGASYGVAWASAIHGLIAAAQGELGEAAGVYRDGLENANRSWGQHSYAGSMLSLLLAEILYECNELEEAEAHLEIGLTCVKDYGSVEFALPGYIVLARLRAARGNLDEAHAFLQEGEQLGRVLRLPRLTLALTAERIRLMAAGANPNGAMVLARSAGFLEGAYDIVPGDKREITREIAKLTSARLLMAGGEPSRAVPLLNALLQRARETGRIRKLVELAVVKSIALDQQGRDNEALRQFDEAIRIGAPHGFLRTFVDEGPAVEQLLRRYFGRLASVPIGAETQPARYLQSLAKAFSIENADVPQNNGREDPAPSEPLTRREKQLLNMIGSGLSNRELAASLFISEPTVKWHLYNLYAKLGVRSRTGALARARRLSLIG